MGQILTPRPAPPHVSFRRMRTLVHESSKLPVRPARELQNKFIRHRLHTALSRRAAIFTLSKTHSGLSALAAAPSARGLPLQRIDLGLQLGDALTLPHMLR